jgi:HAE1 family hydrophobic/amphiphilic exporter-1
MGQLRVSAWAIRNPIPIGLLMLALITAGAIAYGRLPIKQYPAIDFPAVSITIAQAGAAPAELETQVTRPVENALAGLPNVEAIVSTVAQGGSTTTVQFHLGENLQKATDEVRTRIDQLRPQLPAGIETPIVRRIEIEDAPILTYAVSSDRMSLAELSWFIQDTIARALQQQEGVGQVSRVGGVDREVNVIVDPTRLAATGLTLPELNEALRRVSADDSGGRARIGDQEQPVRILNTAATAQTLRDLTLPAPGERFVRLGDIATIGDGQAETRAFARLDGAPVVGFQVAKTRDASELAVEDRVTEAVKALQAAHPDIHIRKIFSAVDQTRASYNATLEALVEGLLLTALAVLIFLRDGRATLITALAMPASLIPTFACMAALGFSLNIVTLLALTLVTGILVDDAIVEIENIEIRLRTGLSPREAAMTGADAIGLAVVATTAAIVAVFTPVSFMGGIPGQFFREFGLTVSIAVLFSLLVARLFTPLLAAHLLAPSRHPEPEKRFTGPYRDGLAWVLSHRIVVVVSGLLVFAASLAIAPLLPVGFQPTGDPDYFYVKVQGAPGATAAQMDATVRAASALLEGQPETEAVFAQVGSKVAGITGGDRSAADLRDATLTVVLHRQRMTSVQQIKQRLRPSLRSIPDANVSLLGDSAGAEVPTVLTGEDGAALDQTAAELLREMGGLSQIADPRPSVSGQASEVAIRPKADEAARLGVSTDTLAAVVRAATIGEADTEEAKLSDGARRIPIKLRFPEDALSDLSALRALQVPTAFGGVTPLGAVADLDFETSPAKINRFDRRRQLTIEADLNNGAQLGDAARAIRNLPIMRHLPAGVSQSTVGNQRSMDQLFASLGMVFFIGVSTIFAVLVLLFNSVLKPITILTALPPAVCGAFALLFVTGQGLNLPSLIGLLMLLGLSAKNSILLVEYAIEREAEGMGRIEAVMDACRARARPIIMTSFAMGAGMLPAALAFGKGAEFRQPMAIAVIGGLITTTLMSLVIVPAVYSLIGDAEAAVFGLGRRRDGGSVSAFPQARRARAAE